jgi:hypothetical protein
MPERGSFDITIPVRELAGHERQRWQGHAEICHGEAPGTDAPESSMRFHLGISMGGERLFLFREGHQPQELVLSDLVGIWLDAARGQIERVPICTACGQPEGDGHRLDGYDVRGYGLRRFASRCRGEQLARDADRELRGPQ